jgi:GNAT superfamily N-acetyltransferase
LLERTQCAKVGFMNERTLHLRDGGRFEVRAMEPDDADVVLAGFRSLSPQSLRTRFFTAVPRIAPDVEHELVRVDHHDRIVLLAFDDHGHLAGGARAIRDHLVPTSAEVAVTVGDAYQGRGLGSRLLRHVGGEAWNQGIDHLVGHVMVENAAARTMLVRNGASCRLDEPGVLAFSIPLDRRAVRTHVPMPPQLTLAS